MTAIPILRDAAFEPQDIAVMSMALEEICNALGIPADRDSIREMIAWRIIELVRRGEHSAARLCDRLLSEAAGKLRSNED